MLVFYILLFYITTNILGFFTEKIKIPRIYAALFLGVALSTNTAVLSIVDMPRIHLLTQMGMFSLLFLLGFNLNLDQIKSQGSLIIRVTIMMIAAELVVGTAILHFIFDVNWILAAIISLSFATVGEVAILPILQEFKIVKTKLGQAILGVSILDDVVEILAFALIIFYISGITSDDLIAEILPLVAIGSGYLVQKTIHSHINIEKIVSIAGLYILGPFFFFYAGTESNLNLFIKNIVLIFFITLVINITKLISVHIASRKQLGFKRSIIMGISLSIKFSTSIIILIILLQKHLITEELFSVLIGEKVMFKFIVPIALSYFLTKWSLDLKKPVKILQ